MAILVVSPSLPLLAQIKAFPFDSQKSRLDSFPCWLDDSCQSSSWRFTFRTLQPKRSASLVRAMLCSLGGLPRSLLLSIVLLLMLDDDASVIRTMLRLRHHRALQRRPRHAKLATMTVSVAAVQCQPFILQCVYWWWRWTQPFDAPRSLLDRLPFASPARPLPCVKPF